MTKDTVKSNDKSDTNNTKEIRTLLVKPEISKWHITDERIRHMHGVAELMYQYYDAFNCKYLSRGEVYILGLNHDIGYMIEKDGHEFYGARIFEGFSDVGRKNVIAKCILHHGDTPKQFMGCHKCSADEIPGELLLLWWADMCVESGGEQAGEAVGFEQRLRSLGKRYGENSDPCAKCKESMDWLKSHLPEEIKLTL